MVYLIQGVKAPSDVALFGPVDAVLVGEALMRSKDKSAFIRSIQGIPVPTVESRCRIKICGLSTLEDALFGLKFLTQLQNVV